MKTVRFQSSNLTSAGSVSKNKTVERYGRANREMKKKKREEKKKKKNLNDDLFLAIKTVIKGKNSR